MNTVTTPYGNVEPRFDLCELAVAAGATYVSRWSTFRSRQGTRALQGALQHRGFSLVEFVAQCPTNFGRRALGSGNPAKNVQWIEERSVTLEQAKKLSPEERASRFVLGDFLDIERPVFAGSSTLARGGDA